MSRYTFYVIRHGQTKYNVDGIVQGWNDSPLTETGIYQAKCAGYGLRNIHFDSVYSGDAKRQIDTAALVLSQNLCSTCKIEADARLREMCYGHYQDGPYFNMLNCIFEMIHVPFGDFEEARKHITANEVSTYLAAHNADIETVESVQKRILETLNEIMESHQSGGTFLISTSSCAMDDLIEYVSPHYPRHGLVNNAGVCRFETDGRELRMTDFDNIKYRLEGERHFAKST